MRFFVLPIFDGVIMDGHPIFLSWWIPATPASTTQNIGCPSIMTPSKMGKTKNLIFYSLNLYLKLFDHGSIKRVPYSMYKKHLKVCRDYYIYCVCSKL